MWQGIGIRIIFCKAGRDLSHMSQSNSTRLLLDSLQELQGSVKLRKGSIPSQKMIAEFAGVTRGSMRTNVRLLLTMVIKRGYSLNESVARKMNTELLKSKKKGRFGR